MSTASTAASTDALPAEPPRGPAPLTPELQEVKAKLLVHLDDETLADLIITVGRSKGLRSVRQAATFKESHWVSLGVSELDAPGIVAAFSSAALTQAAAKTAPSRPAATATFDPAAELPDGKVAPGQVDSFASLVGANPIALMMLMNGNGGAGEFSLADIIPIETVMAGYNPRVRNLYYQILGAVEDRFGTPIIAVNDDGSVNKTETVRYVNALDQGRDELVDGAYYSSVSGEPMQLTSVGVDLQSTFDADPLDATNEKVLTSANMGTGRINYTGVDLSVKQFLYYARQTGEINPNNAADMDWLREKVKPGVTRSTFIGKAPKANTQFNTANRDGSLPTLRRSLPGRKARRPETMPRRQRGDISGIGSNGHTRDGRSDPRRTNSPFGGD